MVLGGLAVFQLALIVGAPLGEFAWGGADRVLPLPKRIGSAVSIVLYGVIAAIILTRAGSGELADHGPIVIAAWVVTGYFALGIILNALSKSRRERFTMTPIVALLTALSLIVALS